MELMTFPKFVGVRLQMFFCRSPQDEDVGAEMPVSYPLRSDPIANAAFIPIRLTMKQRKSQRLVRAIVLASSYTDKVDQPAFAKGKRELAVVNEVLNAFRGFVVASDLRLGAELIEEKEFQRFEKELKGAIEVSRRYKIMNPDLLRTDYMKFLFLIQDAAQNENCRQALGFNVATPILTCKDVCARLKLDDLLNDPRLPVCITPVPRIKSIDKLNKALRFKDVSVNKLCKDYAARVGCSPDDVEMVIRSLNDANNFANSNRDSAEAMMKLLQEHFSPARVSPQETLAIMEGAEGSRLTHGHEMQYNFVLQSLALWKNISDQMFRLWIIAEDDLLNPDEPYEFRNTGQGFQRVQKAPRLFEALTEILNQTKRELGQWVGSDRIHLGDNQVPNAFNFIDKYAQISRILIPILRTVGSIDARLEGKSAQGDNVNADSFNAYIDSVFGNGTGAKVSILRDFFRHAFDGSGGDNMEDAGSCIDGRLTSAWNWCNGIKSKPFYPLFLLAGFQTFDGDMSL